MLAQKSPRPQIRRGSLDLPVDEMDDVYIFYTIYLDLSASSPALGLSKAPTQPPPYSNCPHNSKPPTRHSSCKQS